MRLMNRDEVTQPRLSVPGTSDQVLIDRPFEQGLDMLVGLRPIHAVEPLLTEIANTWCELQAEQIEEGEEHFRVACGIRGMLGNGQFGFIIQNFIQDVGGIATGGGGHL